MPSDSICAQLFCIYPAFADFYNFFVLFFSSFSLFCLFSKEFCFLNVWSIQIHLSLEISWEILNWSVLFQSFHQTSWCSKPDTNTLRNIVTFIYFFCYSPIHRGRYILFLWLGLTGQSFVCEAFNILAYIFWIYSISWMYHSDGTYLELKVCK